MKNNIFFPCFIIAFAIFLFAANSNAQLKNNSSLTIEYIMRDGWIGTSPSNFRWSKDSETVFFSWKQNSENRSTDYSVSVKNGIPEKAEKNDLQNVYSAQEGVLNHKKNKRIFVRSGDLFLYDIKSKDTLQITNTLERISSAYFSSDDDKIIYNIGNNVFTWDIDTGQTVQRTNFVSGEQNSEENNRSGQFGQFGMMGSRTGQSREAQKRNVQDEWLYQQQLFLFDEYKEKEGNQRTRRSSFRQPRNNTRRIKRPKAINIEGKSVFGVNLSSNLEYVTYLIYESTSDESSKSTEMPMYVTKSGYTEIRKTRSKVGVSGGFNSSLMIYDVNNDTVYPLRTDKIPGIKDLPDYVKDYPERADKKACERGISISAINWSKDGKYPVINVTSDDNKDRWIMLLELKTGIPKLLDRQRDEAWIGGPGTRTIGWMPDNKRIWFQSEETGYSHLYTINVETGEKIALTSGKYEVYSPRMSNDKKSWYFSSNKVHPGERHFYNMPLNGGKAVQITSMEGSNRVIISPDENYLAIEYSYSNTPPELYIMKNKAGEKAKKITSSLSEEFKSYKWRAPEVLSFIAEDGTEVYARLYQPDILPKNGPAVIFVHGAGYLQNAHKWWSSYYHEYLFHNLLVDNGYTVLDIDYRGSAGYGRDFRTGIYRHMGGKDLSDQVDGAKLLVEKFNIDPDKIGLYGGSYGGFITLMAMFTEADVFTSGAALRSVTDWAHYNHGYTANILNTPSEDSLAYIRSSPIYFAEGFKGHLVMLHGMVDSNVHFQDVVRLSQRLIELGKDNWELAVFPVESHGFTRPTSWTDEYKRIYKLFETTLK